MIVKTAMGVATIIQVPDKPNSVVVGDLNAYKVEYLDTAITIKPLSGRAKSNLYIYTDYRRFNVQLQTGTETTADYVVYLENPKADTPKSTLSQKSSDLKWTKTFQFMMNGELRMQVTRLGQDSHGLCFIEFILKSDQSEALDPAWFWLTQKYQSKPIQRLVLSSLNIAKSTPVNGTIEILRSDISEDEPLRIELRKKRISSLTIQGVKRWK